MKHKAETIIMSQPTHVNIILDSDSNGVLTESALKNERSKRKEAQARLLDHLKRFPEQHYQSSTELKRLEHAKNTRR